MIIMHQINPDKQTVESCLKNKSYSIDFYQREYIWSKETVEILLDDIFHSFDVSYEEHKDADLSQELLSKFNWYYLNIFITNDVNGKIYIVDGQQRLTTLTLIGTKLYHMVENESFKDALKNCIYGKDKWKGNIFRLDHEKRCNVMECILEEKAFLGEHKSTTEKNLLNRYKDISKYFDEKYFDEKKLETFISYFLERLVLVELAITQDDTAMIFEVINDRGEALKPFEILKGKMIGSLDKTDTEKYSEYWDNAMFRLSTMEDMFFIDYLKSKFIFKRNSKLEATINNTYHRYIFERNEISDKLGFYKNSPDRIENIKKFIKEDLEYYSELYARVKKNEDTFLGYNKINDLSGHYQVIMAACSINDPDEAEKISTIAKEFDRLYMLLNLNNVYDSNKFQEISYSFNEKINGVQVSNYRNIFKDVIKDTIKERKQVENVECELEYRAFFQKTYANTKSRLLKYLFARIEAYLCENTNQNMQNNIEYISTKTGHVQGYHIEHILSRNELNKSYFASEEEFEIHRNLLGGLLLLKGLDNISSGNESYDQKLKTYSAGLVYGHSLNKDFYHTNKNLEEFNNILYEKCECKLEPLDVFDNEALMKRSKLLYHLIRIIWEVE